MWVVSGGEWRWVKSVGMQNMVMQGFSREKCCAVQELEDDDSKN